MSTAEPTQQPPSKRKLTLTRRSTLILVVGLVVLAVLLAVGIPALQRSRSGETTAVSPGLPTGYTEPIADAGSVSEFDYSTTAGGGRERDKQATVYLPFGYNPDDNAKRYNVLYLMHGGGGDERTWLGTSARPAAMTRILDHLIAAGTIAPVIVVAPTFDVSPTSFDENVANFSDEVRADLVPKFEASHHTYAADVTPAGLTASRDHRAFGGFSMGSVTTWHIFQTSLDYFAGFLPMSGDSWAVAQFGGLNDPMATAQALADSVDRSGYTADQYVLYTATGSEDIAYQNLTNQVTAMRQLNTFRFADDGCTPGVATFHVTPGNHHDYSAATEYAYRGLPCLFT